MRNRSKFGSLEAEAANRVGGDFVVLSWEEDSECSIPTTEPSGLYQKED